MDVMVTITDEQGKFCLVSRRIVQKDETVVTTIIAHSQQDKH